MTQGWRGDGTMARNQYSTAMVETEIGTLSALHTLRSAKIKVMLSFSKPLRHMRRVRL
jgi:hypothetical protein